MKNEKKKRMIIRKLKEEKNNNDKDDQKKIKIKNLNIIKTNANANYYFDLIKKYYLKKFTSIRLVVF